MAIATVNPATGVVEATFEPHSADEVERRVEAAARAHETLRATSLETRATWMHAAADLIEEDVEELARLVTVEMGKPIAQAEAEVRKCAKGMRYYAEHAEAMLAEEPLEHPDAIGARRAARRYEPLGVVLAVMPWNYPLWQVMRFAAPALMAGNAALLKHASNVPQAALYLDALFRRAGWPEGAFSALLIGSGEVAAVVEDPRIAAVTLTGSEGAGRSVAATAGRAIKKTVLELGGSDPFIVMPSARLEDAVEAAVATRTINNGQSCICGKRFVVHDDVYDAFVEALTARFSALVMGDPLDSRTQVGPLATQAGRAELAELVDDAVAKGAELLVGGSVPEGAGWFYPPTVLAGLRDDMRLVQEEAFGPVATVYRVADRDQALRIANQTAFGLSSAVWSEDPQEQDWFIERIAAGAVFVNGMSVSYPELPFGGIRASGYGRELSEEGIREFCNLKSVWVG